ncbi:hypothetical protein LPJ61_001487 [Coemansia biformis]|uniref:Maintenance of telomere capping protein 1 n=1 Tax=Coemansia biformis TaxID=1286918 RepID=A0A9W8D0K5_9FUNG|nr:hypothetical protein LPJ61_001487 [Coemansia biformis]
MSPRASTDAGSKKKAHDEALQFLETLEISDEGATGGQGGGSGDPSGADGEGAGASSKDAKGMLKFIDDLTESAKRGTSPGGDGGDDAGGGSDGNGSSAKASGEKQPEAGGGWSWGGIWGQAAALVEQNQQFKSGLGKLKESIDQVRNTEASKSIESRVRTMVAHESIAKLGGDVRRSLNTVIDTIAPPIQEHEVFSVRLVSNLQDANIESVVYRTMDAVFEFHGCGEINVKSASSALADAPEMQAKRGDTFTLPKGFDGGYGAAVTAVQYIQNLAKTQAKEAAAAAAAAAKNNSDAEDGGEAAVLDRSSSPLFYRAHKTELLLAIQPFSAMPIEDQGFLSLCAVLRDPARDVTLRTFSQMLPLSCWAKPHDQIVAVDVDASLGTVVNMRSDSAVQRKQEMNEECLYEAVMLAVKTLANEYLATRPAAAGVGQV